MKDGGEHKGSRSKAKRRQARVLEQVNLYAAGIDVGATSQFVAAPEELDTQPLREFAALCLPAIGIPAATTAGRP